MSGKAFLVVLCGLLLVGTPLVGAEFTVVNADDPGVGLNDPTPASPIGGNPGTTLGEQRLNVLERVGEIWGERLQSNVTIVVSASTTFFSCEDGAILATAASNFIYSGFSGAILPNTWYHSALANALAGSDRNASRHDITTNFNIGLDEDPMCSDFGPWYYGLDHNANGKADLLATLLHEFGHGLGFSAFIDGETGEYIQGRPDVFTTYMRDLSTGKDWNDMTNNERVIAGVNDPNVVWTGPNATAAINDFLVGSPIVRVDSPGSIRGDNAASQANFGEVVKDDLTAQLVLANDGSGVPSQACFPIVNDLTGKIALIDRGNCDFVVKVLQAQEAGAIGVVVANNEATAIFNMGDNGNGQMVTIPAVMVDLSVGTAIKGALNSGTVTVTLASGPDIAGTNGGFIRLHAPSEYDPGSSLSHWTVDAFPNLLMEPNINDGLNGVDLTAEQLKDVGWTLLAVEEEMHQLIYPWLSFHQLFNSVLVLNNTSSQPADVTLTGRRTTGEPFTATVEVPSFGFVEQTVDQLFLGLDTGGGFSVVAASDSTELAGRWVTNALQTGSDGSPSQGIAVNLADISNKTNGRVGNALLFGYLPVDAEITSAPVIVNAGSAAADIILYFYDAAGNLLKTDTESIVGLESFRPFTRVITDLVDPGENVSMIAYSPNQPISGVVFVFNQSALEPAIGNAQVIEFTPP